MFLKPEPRIEKTEGIVSYHYSYRSKIRGNRIRNQKRPTRGY